MYLKLLRIQKRNKKMKPLTRDVVELHLKLVSSTRFLPNTEIAALLYYPNGYHEPQKNLKTKYLFCHYRV